MQDVELVFVATDCLLAPDDSFEAQNGHFVSMNARQDEVPLFLREPAQAGYFVDKIHRRAVLQINDRVGPNRCAQFAGNVEKPDVLARRQIDPQIHIQRIGHHPLRDGRGHTDDDVADLLRFERFQ